MVCSKFETLPVELIVEIGDYLDGCDFYKSFHGLNHCIDQILDQQCRRFYVNFTKISKNNFDSYCKSILPRICHRIISLTLCGNNSSRPGQFSLLFSTFSNNFPKLESLKLFDYSKTDVELLLSELNHLTHLKYLSIGNFQRLMPHPINRNELFNENIVFPENLTHLAFPHIISDTWFAKSNQLTSKIQRMHVHFIYMNCLILFLQKFPYLTHLTAVLSGDNTNNVFEDKNIFQSLSSLRYLNVNITPSVKFDQFGLFLEKVPQLRSLSVETLNPDVSFFQGHEWERILPLNLCSFHFDITRTDPFDLNPQELLNSFKNQYWLSRHWLVNCHLRDQGRYFRLFTVQSPLISILYWPDDEIPLESSTNSIRYPHVNHMKLWWNLSKSTNSICPKIDSIELYGAGAGASPQEPIDSNVYQILQTSSLEHLIIDDDIPITPKRFGSIFVKSSSNIHILTCSANWLRQLFDDRQNEWICLLLTKRIRKLIISNDNYQPDLISNDLISFCRIFINLHEITIHLETIEHLCFLLNILTQLTMARITLPNSIIETIDFNQWIQQNTILENFLLQQDLNTCILILWIEPNSTTNLGEIRMQNQIFNTIGLDDL